MEQEKKIVGLGFYPKEEKNINKILYDRNNKLESFRNEISLVSDLIQKSETKLLELHKDLESENDYKEKEKIEYDISREEKNLVELKAKKAEKEKKVSLLYGSFENNTVGFEFQNENDHIIESVKRIISTRRGERIGNLAFGSDVSKYLFMPDMSIDDVIQEISNSIARNDNRIEVVECTLKAVEWDTIEIDLKVRVKRTNKILEISTNVKGEQ